MCDCATQDYRRRLSVISSTGADDKVCDTSFDMIDPGSNLPFSKLFSPFSNFKITSEKHLCLIKMKEITKKLKIKYCVGLG